MATATDPAVRPPFTLEIEGRKRAIVRTFNQGRISIDGLMRVTTSFISQCGTDWQAAIGCLRALRNTRNPASGHPVPPDRICFHAAMVSCARAARYLEAIELFNEMLALGLFPVADTYACVLGACAHAGQQADALGLLGHMLTHGPARGVPLTAVALLTAIDACGPVAAQELLDFGITRGIFMPTLGFDPAARIQDLHQNAVLAPAWRTPHDVNVRPSLALALLRRLACGHALGPGFRLSMADAGGRRLRAVLADAVPGTHWVFHRATAPGGASNDLNPEATVFAAASPSPSEGTGPEED